MASFDRWVLEADHPETLPSPGEFLWSAGTHFLFKRCPRAWYYTHYLAQGGWELHSRERSCHAYLLKYLHTVQSFLERSTQEALFHALQETLSVPDAEERAQIILECFQTEMTERYFRALDDVERSRYLRDPKYIYFTELHYASEPQELARGLFRDLLERLKSFFRNFEGHDIAELLAENDPLYFHKEYTYKTFCHNLQKIVLPPWIFQFTGKELHAWKISFDPDDTQEDLLTMHNGASDPEYCLSERLLSLWCQHRYGQNVPCIVTTLHQGKERFTCRKVRFSPPEEDLITESAAKILKILDLPGGIREKNFPCTETKESCPTCRFRALCRV